MNRDNGMMKKYIFLAATTVASFFSSCTRDEEELPGIPINGVRWASTNVAAPGTFAASAPDGGMHYQWGRPTGWYTEGSADPLSSPAGETWNPTPATGSRWEPADDPCPEGWRLPTQRDFIKLFDSSKVSYRGTSDKEDDSGGGIEIPGWESGRAAASKDAVTKGAAILMRAAPKSAATRGSELRPGLARRDELPTGAKGIVFTDRQSGKQLFLPAAGVRIPGDGRRSNFGTDGFYWFVWEGPGEPDPPTDFPSEFYAYHFWFAVKMDETPPKLLYNDRVEGYSVRCVLERPQ